MMSSDPSARKNFWALTEMNHKSWLAWYFYPDVTCPDKFKHSWESEAAAKLWHPGVQLPCSRPQFPSFDGWFARNVEKNNVFFHPDEMTH